MSFVAVETKLLHIFNFIHLLLLLAFDFPWNRIVAHLKSTQWTTTPSIVAEFRCEFAYMWLSMPKSESCVTRVCAKFTHEKYGVESKSLKKISFSSTRPSRDRRDRECDGSGIKNRDDAQKTNKTKIKILNIDDWWWFETIFVVFTVNINAEVKFSETQRDIYPLIVCVCEWVSVRVSECEWKL